MFIPSISVKHLSHHSPILPFLILLLFLLTLYFGAYQPSPAVAAPLASAAGNYYASTKGSLSGDGSLSNPWDLATALANSAGLIQPGDTLWLRGGTYKGIFTSHLSGLAGKPITVRSYPGEWVVIDTRAQSGSGDTFKVFGSYTIYRDFELMNSLSANRSESGFAFLGGGTGNKFINMLIHDLGNNTLRDGNELYGCLLYNNGVDGSGGAHHLYIQNGDSDHPVRVANSIIFNGFAFGVHAYSSGAGLLDGIHLSGNVWFNNGVAQTQGDRKDNVLIAGVDNCPDHILLEGNYGWAPSPTTRSLSLGKYCSTANGSIALGNNYLVGDTSFVNPWDSASMSGNTFCRFNTSSTVDPASHPDNTYLITQPTENRIILQPNQYDSGRAHLIVYNWQLLNTVRVDVSQVLREGDIYQVRNAQNYFAPPVLEGTFDGDPLALPMNGLEPVQPIGPGLIEPSEYTGLEFNVFVLDRLNDCPDCHEILYLPLITN